MLSVHQRPFPPEDRSEPGHWEGDVIVGPQHRSAIGTLVERHSRHVKLIHLPRQDSMQLRDGPLRELAGLPAALLRSITWDQGTEMARHLEITAATGAAVYLCDAGSPWQRDTNEKTNGFLRQYFPKGTDLSRHSRSELARVEHELNHRPRAILDDRSPAEIFTQLPTSTTAPCWNDRWKPPRRAGVSFQTACGDAPRGGQPGAGGCDPRDRLGQVSGSYRRGGAGSRWMDLRYAGVCKVCGTDLPAGTCAYWDSGARTVTYERIECASADRLTETNDFDHQP
jgi:hypothetical protein